VTLIIIPRHKPINNIKENHIVINMPLIHIASSQLRAMPNPKFIPKPIINYIAQNGLYIEQQIKPLLSKSRYEHTLRVMKLALEIAKAIKYKFLKKVYVAAMYHDVCKEFDDKKITTYAKLKHQHIHVLHGFAGANYIKKHFNINDHDILEAISNHVIPNKNPSLLTKILYCADKLEPNRTKQDIHNRLQMVKLVKKDINKYF
jgi:nicotinate-nucleotide adenylyltransferase